MVATTSLCVCLCEQLNDELKQNLKATMTNKYRLGKDNEHITQAVDKLQEEVSRRMDKLMV